MEKSLDRLQYTSCLQRMFGIVAAWEDHSATFAPEWMREGVTSRRRQEMLGRDLAWFKLVPSPARAVLPSLQDVPSLLGAMYVMEGSTLGGQFIARHVEAVLGLEKGLGNAYFVGHGDRTGTMWKSFCQVLTERVHDDEADAVVQGARLMFTTFGSWMRGSVADAS